MIYSKLSYIEEDHNYGFRIPSLLFINLHIGNEQIDLTNNEARNA